MRKVLILIIGFLLLSCSKEASKEFKTESASQAVEEQIVNVPDGKLTMKIGLSSSEFEVGKSNKLHVNILYIPLKPSSDKAIAEPITAEVIVSKKPVIEAPMYMINAHADKDYIEVTPESTDIQDSPEKGDPDGSNWYFDLKALKSGTTAIDVRLRIFKTASSKGILQEEQSIPIKINRAPTIYYVKNFMKNNWKSVFSGLGTFLGLILGSSMWKRRKARKTATHHKTYTTH